jgi:hypothetical protein
MTIESFKGAAAESLCLSLEGSFNLFPEMASSLFYFMECLYRVLNESKTEQVFFLSREGQPLMRMFEMYREKAGGRMVSRYLEVSRRSTLLPSLAPISEEGFYTLFRQYRRMSLLEFLSSLGLEAHAGELAGALGLPDGAEALREEDFPTSGIFNSLKALPRFIEIYESERLERRRAFLAYLSELSGGAPPARLVVVDVGWKGTIQDNLFALLCRNGDTPVREITGYYVGLVAKGAAGPGNDKYGLLFSAVDERSPRFRVFNENRALFEVMLAADHGSVFSYEIDATGQGRAVCGEFEEGEMLAAKVFPLQRQMFAHFERLVAATPAGRQRGMPFEAVVRTHARMVFRPTPREIAWFSSVFHVENYGVFERSYFAVPGARPRLFQRLHFLARLLLRRRFGVLGFWPWSVLHARGGALPAMVYGAIRRRQR